MIERQRLSYLEHLGIDAYIPRRVCPGAAPSTLLSADHFENPAAVTVVDNVAKADSTDSLAAAINTYEAAHEQDSGEPSTRTAAVEVLSTVEVLSSPAHSPRELTPPIADVAEVPAVGSVDSSQAPPSTTTSVRFALSVWRISEDVLVIDSRLSGSALPTDKLLQNMLRAVGLPLAQLPPADIIRWPIFKGMPGENDADEAQAMVQAYIAAQSSKSSLQTVWVMGKEAACSALALYGREIASQEESYNDCLGTVTKHADWDCHVAVLPSLADMLHEPLLKRQAWQALLQLQNT